ncbi:MAG: mandelate racemase/muconate lactonizing enzyme family protein [Nocardioidaceae bacterium]
MTITEVRCHRLTAALHTPFVTALRSTTTVETTVVELVDDEGERGFGEAPQVWRVTGESLEGAQACILGPLAAVIRGRSTDDLTDLLAAVADAVVGNHGAKAAVDVALHDLAARRLGVSLPRFFGSNRHQVETDVTVSAGDVDSLRTDAAKRVSEGFDVLKLKVGSDAETDVARVKAVRHAIGPATRIRVDANQGWTAREAIGVIRALEDSGVGVEFVEQPVAAADLDGMARVTASVDTPVMADESVFGLRDLSALIERGAADLVNIKLAKCGGLATARAMLRLASAHGVGTIVGSMMESPIGVGAAASLVAAYGTPNTNDLVTSDLDAAWWTARSPVRGGLQYDAATVVLPTSPGLGIGGLV